MIVEIKIPTPGESITEVELGSWLVEDGAAVEKDQEIAEIESDKATLTLSALEAGKITRKVEEGDTVEVGAVACTIDTSAAPEKKGTDEKPVSDAAKIETKTDKQTGSVLNQQKGTSEKKPVTAVGNEAYAHVKTTSVAEKMMDENGLSIEDVLKGLKRIGKKEIETVLSLPDERPHPKAPVTKTVSSVAFSRELKREKMSSLRRKLSTRLVAVKNETAMLTTFNEVDMTRILEIRKQYQPRFLEKYGFKLGFMSFFTKAVATAAHYHPMVNSMIDEQEIVIPQFVDVGIAVSTPKGLMVPIVRNAESKSIPVIELEIKELAQKARTKKITVEELTGGTFTITNGGTFGSLLSTPIINPPQSAILGMHNIVQRPMAVQGKVEIRPMMYVALSYDHRLIDGKDSVGFLVKLKGFLENPHLMLTEGESPEKLLLEL